MVGMGVRAHLLENCMDATFFSRSFFANHDALAPATDVLVTMITVGVSMLLLTSDATCRCLLKCLSSPAIVFEGAIMPFLLLLSDGLASSVAPFRLMEHRMR